MSTADRTINLSEIQRFNRSEIALSDLPNGYLSHSAEGTHSRCPKQYEFRYHMHAPELIGTALVLGSAVHLALEFSDVNQIRLKDRWSPQQAGDQAAEALPMLIADHQEKGNTIEWRTWKERKPEDKGKRRKKGDPEFEKIEIVETLASLQQDAFALAHTYEVQVGPLIEALSAEVEYKIPFDEYGITVRGFIDVILNIRMSADPKVDHLQALKDGLPMILHPRVVTDRKTSRRYEKGYTEEAVRSLQLTKYQRPAELMGVDPSGLQIHRGTVNKEHEAIWRLTAVSPLRTRDQVDGVLRNGASRAQLIRTGVFPMTEDPKTCGMCGYRKACKPFVYAGETPDEEEDE